MPNETTDCRPMSREDWIYWQSLVSDEHNRQVERLRRFAQWVADHSNDPAVVQEAKLHGAE